MYRVYLISKIIFIFLFGVTFYGGYSHAAGLADARYRDSTLMVSSLATYRVIILKNLFNPGRVEMWNAGQSVEAQGVRRVARVDMILEGIIIFDGYRAALIRQGSGRSGGVITAKVGDVIGAYKIKSIEDEEVVLNGSGGEMSLTLFNFDDPARRRHIKTGVRGNNPAPQRPGIRPGKGGPKANVPHRSK